MATQDNSPGLLSKMARFVRNPTKDWAELDKPAVAEDADHGKEALKLVIERKRHDDAIRKREFSKLRKLRQASPVAKAELSQGLSSFRSTTGDIDTDTHERATTLKKIDEIEAQMSHQWWRGRSGAVPMGSAEPTVAAPTPGMADANAPAAQDSFPATQMSRLSPTTLDPTTQADSAAGFDFRPTEQGVAPMSQTSDDYAMSPRSAFSISKMVSVDMGQNLSDPEMEEAAIRYANGDDVGAEVALQAALQIADAAPELAEGWAAALLDLYRSTGQQANFERMAMAYAQRFGRSAPTWSDAPPSMAPSRPALSPTAAVWPVAGARQHWVSPVELDDVAVAQLRDMVWSGTVTYGLDWRLLQRMSASAAKSLAELLARWCETPLSLRFEGAATLASVLRALTPHGDKAVPKYLWQLRFDALRLLRLQDDYELAALDFCVTYEVSPPPWRVPICQVMSEPKAPAAALPEPVVLPELAQQLVLVGDVTGDVSDIVARWQRVGGEDGLWGVSCAQLTRVDFSAAGGLLNWVAHMTAEGHRVEFREMPRLVAAFFNLIGINEHAQVTVRTN
ncbi:MAG: STAS domain-containing protein [Rhodoferax sp.]|uniref:STAS domain-containing protein n=1 Tax=Rhodoferax sp. TaxID=50421 RepID=UPI00260F38F3|nr:STAS domain-containing protein [Rhodoferax sp.]MDD2882025.1 STAS domain-containing protein [Rhodoferax sp.]